jgi:uncharacterized protein
MKKATSDPQGTCRENTNPVLAWWAGGLGIGLVLIVAVGLVQPIGVSTQYVVLDGVLLHSVLPDVASKSPYLAKTAQGWTLATYEFFFVLGIPLGALMAALVTARFTTRVVPVEWSRRFGSNPGNRLFGARFGGGCTSGHMISGISQLAISSFFFSAALFISGIFTARLLYRDGGSRC